MAGDVASALLTARVRGRRVEVLGARAEDSSLWANPDGSFTSESWPGPVRMRDASAVSGWVDLDPTLVRAVDGSVVPRAHPGFLRLSGPVSAVAGTAPLVPLVSVTDPGDPLAGSARTRSRARGLSWGWRGGLPAPVLEGSRATYPEVRPGMDLVVEVTTTGFEQFLVIKSRPVDPGSVAVVLPLVTRGLRLAGDGAGGARISDGQGRARGRVPAPVMWDARRVPGADIPVDQVPVSMVVTQSSATAASVALTPDPGYLMDPGTVYPVTVDPSATLGASFDTYVQSNVSSTDYSASTELRAGTYDGGATRARSFLTFPLPFRGATVSSATFGVYNRYSYSCTAKPVDVHVASAASAATRWSSQPYINPTLYSRVTASKGYSAACAAGTLTFNVTALAQYWADSTSSVQGYAIQAGSESDSGGWKKFNSAEASSGRPYLSVTYNRPPNTPGTPTHTPGTSSATTTTGWTTTSTPTLRASVTDPDGGSVRGLFSVYLNGGGTPVIDRAYGSSVTSGGVSAFTVPAGRLVNGAWYVVRAYGWDGALTSPSWSAGYDRFTVDTSLPVQPTVTSSTSPENQWSATLDGGGRLAFTATGSSPDTTRVQYSLDTPSYATSLSASANTPVAISLAKPATGQHTLYVRAVDLAGNPSPGRAYVFYYGTGVALAQPGENQVTARRVGLQLAVDPAQVSALGSPSFEYRRGAADAWKPVPLAQVSDTSGAGVSGWPATADSSTVWYWDAAATLGGGGVIEVRARFAGNGSSTEANTVTVDVNGGQAGSAVAGPGTVNLLTGELSVWDTDATLFGASIGRAYGSRSLGAGTDAGQAGAFGPQWALSGALEYTDANWQAVTKTSATSLEVLDSGGQVTAFTLKAGTATAWTPEPGSQDLTLTGSLSDPAGSFTLADFDGNITTFTRPVNGATAPPAGTWPVAATTPTGAGNSARYGYSTDSTGRLRLSRVAAPNPALTSAQLAGCADPASDLSAATFRGCRVLDLTWADPDGAGPFAGQRVTAVNAWAWNPATSAMTSSTEATYSYDASGRLTTVTDPRPAGVPRGAALSTTYGYDGTDLLTTLTPPGELAWTFGYATGATVAGPAWDRALPTSTGRLVAVSRPTLAPGTLASTNGTAGTAIVYGVPTTTGTGPVAVDQAAAGSWGQSVAPVEGTAVFDSDAPAQPTNDYWAGDDTTKRDWAAAAVTFMDVNGRVTNTLGRDGLMDAAHYTSAGDPDFQLTGANRALALGQGPDAAAALAELGLTGLSTDARAQALATLTGYQAGTGGAQRVAWTQGPLRTVVTAAGSQDQQRATTRNTYDTARPAGAATSDLVTSAVTGGLPLEADPATDALDNARSVASTYEWALGMPTTVTTDPSAAAGDEISTRTSYDARGRVTTQSQPSDAAGTGAGTRTTTYWDDNAGSCTGRPEWAGLVCQSGYAGPITGSASNTALPTTTTSYSRTGAPATITETANGATRTTSTVFDVADRPSTITTTATGLGAAPPAQTLTYDPATGTLASTTAGGKTITTTTDKLGRRLTYTDGTGLRSATEYDNLDRAVKTTQADTATGGLARTFATTTAYDPATGRPAAQTDTQGGTLTLGYDTTGNLTTQTQGAASAGGLRVTSRYDTTGAEIERVWTMSGQGDPVLSESAVENIHGQQVEHTMMPGGQRDYAYDGAGRLTSVADLDAGACTVRGYRFDTNSNRTGYTSTTTAATADANGDPIVCPTPTTPAATSSFDTGDRITDTGYTYDPFGRTTRLPLPAGQVLRVAYNANDLVATQTLYANDADANAGAGTNPIDTSTYTLDVTGQRIATRTADDGTRTGLTLTRTLRYAGSTDSPDWTDEGNNTTTRTITGPTGDLTATALIDTTGTTADQLTWQLSNLHGDIAATLPADDTAPMQINRPDEYGASTTTGPRYGWLGAKQRAGDTPAGIVLMGVRLYNPTTGRFLTTDPVPGGSANSYDYVNADPVNVTDLDGRCPFCIPLLLMGGRVAIQFGARYIARRAAQRAAQYAAKKAVRRFEKEGYRYLTRGETSWLNKSSTRNFARGHEIHRRTAQYLGPRVKYNTSRAPDYRFYDGRGRIGVELKSRGRCGGIANCVQYRQPLRQ